MRKTRVFFDTSAKKLCKSVKRSVKRGKNVTAFGRAGLIITMFIDLVMIVHRLVVTASAGSGGVLR